MNDVYELQAEICKTFANPRRIEIIKTICAGEITATQILEKVSISKANLSQHMAMLTDKGLVNSRKHGTSVYYKLSDPRIMQACNLMREVMLYTLEQKNKMLKKAKKSTGGIK